MSGQASDGELRERLRTLREDPPDAGFSMALHRRLAAAGPQDEPSLWRRLRPLLASERRILWPAFGLAAGVAAFLLLAHRPELPRPAAQGAMVAARLPATKVAVVRVNLSAEVAVESAQIRVSLPEGLVFWADGEELAQRAFEWTQPLNAGDNDLPIAVRGLRPGQYRMTVTAQIGPQRVEDEVLLEVTGG